VHCADEFERGAGEALGEFETVAICALVETGTVAKGYRVAKGEDEEFCV
jgi:hypothetical protein